MRLSNMSVKDYTEQESILRIEPHTWMWIRQRWHQNTVQNWLIEFADRCSKSEAEHIEDERIEEDLPGEDLNVDLSMEAQADKRFNQWSWERSTNEDTTILIQ